MGHQQSHAVVDAVIERELDAALAVEPSPEFLARVRTGVAVEPRPQWRLSWTLALAGGGVVVVAVAVALSVSGRSAGSGSEPAAQLTATRLDVPVLTLPSHSPSIAVGATTARPATRLQRQSSAVASRPGIVATNTEPEVLIDAGESAALRRFLVGVREGRVDVSPLPEAVPATVALQAPTEVTIAPIGVEPLIYVEGARQ